MKVAKFGGSSVACAEQFKKVKNIVESDPQRKVIVVSAAGKSAHEPVKVTDMLIRLETAIQNSSDYQQLFAQISERIKKIRDDLGLNVNIEADLAEIKKHLADCSHDYLISRGEFLTAKMMADYLGYHFVDAQKVMIFNDAGFDYQASQAKVNQAYQQYGKVVVPGFYGANEAGQIHLMPRGGSDISGSILANLLNAKLYENWTDVSGILMADPRIVDHSQKIDVLTYDELQELSYMGFNVFQEEAVRPVREKQIPTKILNTNHPEEGGTMVVDSSQHHLSQRMITGIAGKKNYAVITVKKYQLNKHIEVMQKVLAVLQKFNVSINYVPSGNDAFSFICQQHEIKSSLNEIMSKLKANCGLDDVEIKQNIALVAAVSMQLSKRPAIAGKILDYLDNSLINVRLVIQEGSDMKVVFGVANDDYEKTVSKIYSEAMLNDLNRLSA